MSDKEVQVEEGLRGGRRRVMYRQEEENDGEKNDNTAERESRTGERVKCYRGNKRRVTDNEEEESDGQGRG